MVATCKAFPEAPPCCPSCHDDADDYGYWMCSGLPEFEHADVCCTIACWIENNPQRARELYERRLARLQRVFGHEAAERQEAGGE